MWFLSLLTISLPFVLGSTDKRIIIIQKEGLHSYNADPLCTWLRSTKESIWYSHQRQDHSGKGPIGYLNSPGNSLSHHWRILEAIWCLIEEPVVKWPLSAHSNACQKEGQKGWITGSHRSTESSRKVLWVWTSQVTGRMSERHSIFITEDTSKKHQVVPYDWTVAHIHRGGQD